MATIEISRAHALPKAEARQTAEELAKSMEAKLGLTWTWVGDNVEFHAPSGSAKGTKGVVRVLDKAVEVSVELPFLLKMMKGTIEDKINEKLKAIL
jgi:putative polyhydroxyalkanoate system protein